MCQPGLLVVAAGCFTSLAGLTAAIAEALLGRAVGRADLEGLARCSRNLGTSTTKAGCG